MRLFSSKKNLYSPANGHVIALENINDQVFSKRMMGNGFGITKHEDNIYAPINGKVISIFPTKHAIIIEGKNNTNILIHMGLDTVEMNGTPFDIKINVNDEVRCGDLLAIMNSKKIQKSGRDATIVVITPDIQSGSLLKNDIDVTINDIVFKL